MSTRVCDLPLLFAIRRTNLFNSNCLMHAYRQLNQFEFIKGGIESNPPPPKKPVCLLAVALPYMESRLAAVSAYLPSCFSDYNLSLPHTTQLKPVVRLLFYMEALLSGLAAWLPREPGSRDRRVEEKEAFPGQLKHGERSRETKRG